MFFLFMHKSFSAGGVIFNKRCQTVLVNQHTNCWSFPKGKINKGEQPFNAALREIEEETGISSLEFIKELGSYQRYRMGGMSIEDKSEIKHITMYLFVSDENHLQPTDSGVLGAAWFDPCDAIEMLSHKRDKIFLEKILESEKYFLKELISCR